MCFPLNGLKKSSEMNFHVFSNLVCWIWIILMDVSLRTEPIWRQATCLRNRQWPGVGSLGEKSGWWGRGREPEEMVVRSRGLMSETSSGLKLVYTNCLMSSNEVTHVLWPPAEPVRTSDSSHWDMVRIIMVAKLEFSGMSNICKSSGILALHWKINK